MWLDQLARDYSCCTTSDMMMMVMVMVMVVIMMMVVMIKIMEDDADAVRIINGGDES